MSTRSRRLSRALAGALAVSALAAPSAGALPAEYTQGGPSADTSKAAPRPTVTTTIDDGFDVGSAALGAGGAAAVLLLTGGAAASVRHRRLGVAR